jgi:hypothetical protein
MAEERKRLSDILLNSERDRLEQLWKTTTAAPDLKPLPTGTYRCRIVDGKLFTSRNGKHGYKLTLEVQEGEHAGRPLWHDLWLTDDALKYALRDLKKLGVESLGQLDHPLPAGIIIEANVVLKRGDDGAERNELGNMHPFDVVDIDPPKPDPFAPSGPETEPEPETVPQPETPARRSTDAEGFDWWKGEQRNGVPHP